MLGALREVALRSRKSPEAHQPARTHHIGLYAGGAGTACVPSPAATTSTTPFSASTRTSSSDNFFDAVLGIADPRDSRLNFVGGDRDLDFLQAGVDSGDYRYAVTLAPVTLRQFAAVCRQNRIMPPKSTWFQPKIEAAW